jgi:hypothetical protein
VLSLAKDGRKYIFRYAVGCERQVLSELVRLAEDADSGLDWMDAATLGFQVAYYGTGPQVPASLTCQPPVPLPRKPAPPADGWDGPCSQP